MEVNNFTDHYLDINQEVMTQGQLLDSRAGLTKELLHYQTKITNPVARCVAGYGRNMNVFFLIAESLWIWSGRKDVNFLKTFNSRMTEFSDDGSNFHGAYGFRLRNHGVDPLSKPVHPYASIGQDQISQILNLLKEDPNTRRAVASIWDPSIDLGLRNSKDIPCNDMLMFKVRNGALHLSISNRSNDLHWGLTTNLFQFSVILEIMANILGLEVGTQTHNSDSLHVYIDETRNEGTKLLKVKEEFFDRFDLFNLYEYCDPTRFRKYSSLEEADRHIESLFFDLKDFYYEDKGFKDIPIPTEEDFVSIALYLLRLYKLYKQKIKGLSKEEVDMIRINAALSIYNSGLMVFDTGVLAFNFFASRLSWENRYFLIEINRTSERYHALGVLPDMVGQL